MRRPKAIICDIDGCLLDTRAVLKEAEENTNNEADKWRYFQTYANDRDKVGFNWTLGEVLKSLHDSGYKIIFSTVRSEAIRINTKIRLRTDLGFIGDLYMRRIGDLRPAAEVKAEHFRLIREYYDPQIAIDDEDENIKMFAENGLLVMKLNIV